MGYILDLRKKLGHDPIIMAGAGVIIVNDKNEILLGRRTDNGFWDYPAGSMELGESFEECARREALEETGLLCGKMDYLMTLSGKDSFYEYPNKDQVYLAALFFICFDYSGTMKVQEEEVYEQRFFAIDDIPTELPPHKSEIYAKVRDYLIKNNRKAVSSDKRELLDNIVKIHTTSMGADRIRNNLGLGNTDII